MDTLADFARTDTHISTCYRRRRLSGIGAAWHLQKELPRQELRHRRGARGERRHLGPVPLSGVRSDSDM